MFEMAARKKILGINVMEKVRDVKIRLVFQSDRQDCAKMCMRGNTNVL